MAPKDRPKQITQCSDVQEILDQIRLRPSMWIRRGSLRDLQNILFGYHVALQVHEIDEDFAMAPAGPFAQWLQATYGWSMSLGWAAAIEQQSGSEEPLTLFFRLLDEYRGTA